MTPFKPYLIVNRLQILKSGRAVYDETFHHGVNIIRGKNSSGKSTIIDLIFYGLGGDLNKWKPEPASCDITMIEVSLSGKVFALKRLISEKLKQGMDIFEGPLDVASQSDIYHWLRYPYSATENKESFYQAIFQEMGIPYSKSDSNSSITMHQLLRLMYVDQITSIDRLFKFDHFDSPNKRKAIGELLIGLSDFSLYELRVEFQKLDALLTIKIKDIQILHEFLGDQIKTVEGIDLEIHAKQNELKIAETELTESSPNNNEAELFQLDLLRNEIASLNKSISQITEVRDTSQFEIEDSTKFILSLENRLQSIDDSSNVIHALSDIGFHYCPSCFSEVSHDVEGCALCGKANNETSQNPTFKIRKEIEFQINESKQIIERKRKRIFESDLYLNQLKVNLQSQLDALSLMEKPVKEVNYKTRSILIKIGTLNSEIKELNDSKLRFAKLHDLYQNRNELQASVNGLKDAIQIKESGLVKELRKKKELLSSLTLRILHEDKDHEEVFRDGKRVDFDFGEDKVTIDDRALFSASSMVYLKNAFRLALFEASCFDPTYLYPRFLLMDNVEDKGMQPERSHQFQRQILAVSSRITTPHQIIFSTAMISPELDNSDFCIGPYYSDNSKTLQFESFGDPNVE